MITLIIHPCLKSGGSISPPHPPLNRHPWVILMTNNLQCYYQYTHFSLMMLSILGVCWLVDWVLSSRTKEGNICKKQGSYIPAHTYFKGPGWPVCSQICLTWCWFQYISTHHLELVNSVVMLQACSWRVMCSIPAYCLSKGIYLKYLSYKMSETTTLNFCRQKNSCISPLIPKDLAASSLTWFYLDEYDFERLRKMK